MSTTIDAVYDGSVLRPEEPLSLEANTRVRLTIEALPSGEKEPAGFLATARSVQLQGPADWSSRVADYLYGEPDR